jgi:hypothetical protein
VLNIKNKNMVDKVQIAQREEKRTDAKIDYGRIINNVLGDDLPPELINRVIRSKSQFSVSDTVKQIKEYCSKNFIQPELGPLGNVILHKIQKEYSSVTIYSLRGIGEFNNKEQIDGVVVTEQPQQIMVTFKIAPEVYYNSNSFTEADVTIQVPEMMHKNNDNYNKAVTEIAQVIIEAIDNKLREQNNRGRLSTRNGNIITRKR